jgi:hypothetical protein
MVIIGFGLIICAILIAIVHTIVTWNETFIPETLNPGVPKIRQPAQTPPVEDITPSTERRVREVAKTPGRWSRLRKRLTSAAYLADLKVLMWILVAYAALAFGTYIALTLCLETGGTSTPFVIAYGVVTGSDPIPLYSDFKGHNWLYGWILFIHLLSWLFIPLIAAAALDAVYRINEEKKNKGKRDLEIIFRGIGERMGLTGATLEQFIILSVDSLSRKKGADKGE